MATKSSIGWTEATWNPTTGCDKVSPGCKNCYAERVAKRLQAMGQPKYANGFQLITHEDTLQIPYKWKKPRMIFVNSMSDLFHVRIPFDFTDMVFDTMTWANHHIYQILTKRPDQMRRYSVHHEHVFGGIIPLHIWCGVSVESDRYLDRIDMLRKVSCHTRFISFEPLLGPLPDMNLDNIDWVIIGGESGPGFRSPRWEWINDIIDQCEERDRPIPVFFKQWGGIRPDSGGRNINGRTYDGFPSIAKSLIPKHTTPKIPVGQATLG